MKSFFTSFRRLIKKLVHNPFIDLSVGTILLLSGLWDVWETLPQDLSNGNFRGMHGIVIFGFITALRAIAEMFGGLEFMDEAEYVEERMAKRK